MQRYPQPMSDQTGKPSPDGPGEGDGGQAPGALNLPQATAWCGVARKP
jgi:hypothetical protein